MLELRFLSLLRETWSVQSVISRELFWRCAVEDEVRMPTWGWGELQSFQTILRPVILFSCFRRIFHTEFSHTFTDHPLWKVMLDVLYPPASHLSLFFSFSLQICLLALTYVCCFWQLNLCFILSDFVRYLMLFFLSCPKQFDLVSTFCTYPSCVSGHWRPCRLAKLVSDRTSYPPTVWNCLCLYPKHHFFKQVPTLLNSFCLSYVSHEITCDIPGFIVIYLHRVVGFELLFVLFLI